MPTGESGSSHTAMAYAATPKMKYSTMHRQATAIHDI